nr:filamentous hemagglutinin N-terminal domain-containing protein [Sphaerotilus sp.]
MNRIHRTLWNTRHGVSVAIAVAETSRSRGKRSGVSGALLGSVLLQAGAALAAADLPTGAQVSAGAAQVVQSGRTMTVTQTSARAAINWQGFSIGQGASVEFVQPDVRAVVLNRVVGTESSVIDGRLQANGQVFVLNPNGVLFGSGARVDTAGLVASTLRLGDADFMAGRTQFSTGSSDPGAAVVNRGQLHAADGGYVVLMGTQVRNDGLIQARLGSVALAAGRKVSLNFNGDALVGVALDEAALNALVQNGGAIRADGGLVVLTAKAAEGLLDTVVNHTGEVRAQTVAQREGRIYLLGEGGALEVAGTLDASAPQGGHGGFVETSADHVRIAPNAAVTTLAPQGRTGTWLIDPNDYTVAASGGDLTGAQLSTSLASTNVTLASAAGSNTSGSGSVHIRDDVQWSADTTLTLTASNHVNVQANITASGNTAGLVIEPATANGGEPAATGGAFQLAHGKKITLSGASPTLSIAGNSYTVLNSATALQGMSGNLGGYYALGSDVDATATAGWNGGLGFAPVGSGAAAFSGVFHGLGHTLSNLTVNRPDSDYVGLFGHNTGTISHLGLTGAQITGREWVGGIAGRSSGRVQGVSFDGQVAGTSQVGGLLGEFGGGWLLDSHAGGSVSGAGVEVGGLVGSWPNPPATTVSNSYYNLDALTLTFQGVDQSTQVTLGGLYGGQYATWLAGGRVAFADPATYFGAADGNGRYRLGSTGALRDLLAFADNGLYS